MLVIRVALLDGTPTMAEYFAPPSAHPPKAICVLTCGNLFFKLVKFLKPSNSISSYKKKINEIIRDIIIVY